VVVPDDGKGAQVEIAGVVTGTLDGNQVASTSPPGPAMRRC